MTRWVERQVPRPVAAVLRGIWYAALIWGIFFGLSTNFQPLRYWGM